MNTRMCWRLHVADELAVEYRVGYNETGAEFPVPVRFVHMRPNIRGRNWPHVQTRHAWLPLTAAEFNDIWDQAEELN